MTVTARNSRARTGSIPSLFAPQPVARLIHVARHERCTTSGFPSSTSPPQQSSLRYDSGAICRIAALETAPVSEVSYTRWVEAQPRLQSVEPTTLPARPLDAKLPPTRWKTRTSPGSGSGGSI